MNLRSIVAVCAMLALTAVACATDVTVPSTDTLKRAWLKDIVLDTDQNGTGTVIVENTILDAGDVDGPGSSTDNALVRFDGTDGKTLQDGLWIQDDSGNTTVGDGDWFGLGSSDGHILFTQGGPPPDLISIVNAQLILETGNIIGLGATKGFLRFTDAATDLLTLFNANLIVNQEAQATTITVSNPGDPAVFWTNGGTDWYMGLDGSFGDFFRMGTGNTVGENIIATWGTAGGLTMDSEITAVNFLSLSLETDNAFGPHVIFKKQRSDTAQDNDSAGYIVFIGENDVGAAPIAAVIESFMQDVSDGTEDAFLAFAVATGGVSASSASPQFRIRGSGIQLATGASVNDIDTAIVGGGTDDQLLTAQAIKELVDSSVTTGSVQFLQGRIGEPAGLTVGAACWSPDSAGINPKLSLASNENYDEGDVIGLCVVGGSNNSPGTLQIIGLVEGLNTIAWSTGDELWLSSTPGVLTNTEPTQGNVVHVGHVIRDHGSLGSILLISRIPNILGGGIGRNVGFRLGSNGKDFSIRQFDNTRVFEVDQDGNVATSGTFTADESITIISDAPGAGAGYRQEFYTDVATRSTSMQMYRARNTLAAPGPLSSGDAIFTLTAQGFDTDKSNSGQIILRAGADFGTASDDSDSPCEFVVKLAPDGSSTMAEVFTMLSTGIQVVPATFANNIGAERPVLVDVSGNHGVNTSAEFIEGVANKINKRDATTNDVATLLQFRVRAYNRVASPDVLEIGGMAEEVFELDPTMVFFGRDTHYTTVTTVMDDGTTLTVVNRIFTPNNTPEDINYGAMIPKLILIAQQSMARVQVLENQNVAQQDQYLALLERVVALEAKVVMGESLAVDPKIAVAYKPINNDAKYVFVYHDNGEFNSNEPIKFAGNYDLLNSIWLHQDN